MFWYIYLVLRWILHWIALRQRNIVWHDARTVAARPAAGPVPECLGNPQCACEGSAPWAVSSIRINTYIGRIVSYTSIVSSRESDKLIASWSNNVNAFKTHAWYPQQLHLWQDNARIHATGCERTCSALVKPRPVRCAKKCDMISHEGNHHWYWTPFHCHSFTSCFVWLLWVLQQLIPLASRERKKKRKKKDSIKPFFSNTN